MKPTPSNNVAPKVAGDERFDTTPSHFAGSAGNSMERVRARWSTRSVGWFEHVEWQTVDLKQYPNVLRWYLAIAKKPATQKGYKVPKDVGEVPIPA